MRCANTLHNLRKAICRNHARVSMPVTLRADCSVAPLDIPLISKMLLSLGFKLATDPASSPAAARWRELADDRAGILPSYDQGVVAVAHLIHEPCEVPPETRCRIRASSTPSLCTDTWSRRITGEHRLVYRVSGKGSDRQLDILQCRYHYRP